MNEIAGAQEDLPFDPTDITDFGESVKLTPVEPGELAAARRFLEPMSETTQQIGGVALDAFERVPGTDMVVIEQRMLTALEDDQRNDAPKPKKRPKRHREPSEIEVVSDPKTWAERIVEESRANDLNLGFIAASDDEGGFAKQFESFMRGESDEYPVFTRVATMAQETIMRQITAKIIGSKDKPKGFDHRLTVANSYKINAMRPGSGYELEDFRMPPKNTDPQDQL